MPRKDPEKRKKYDRERKRALREANPEKELEKQRAWRAANPEKKREQTRKWATANPEKVRASWIKCVYGLEPERYDRMFAEQGGVCAACKKDCGPRGLQVDHCHTTGKVRGLLCGRCNISVGNDSPEDLFNRGWFLVRDLI